MIAVYWAAKNFIFLFVLCFFCFINKRDKCSIGSILTPNPGIMILTKLAVFASGRGSNFQTVHNKIQAGFIPAEINLLITDNDKAGAIQFADENNIAVEIIKPKEFPSPESFGEAILKPLNRYGINMIVLAGYLKKIPENVVEIFNNRILNIHPALLPAFGGKGMYGIRVHQAVYDSGAKISGATVHLVNNEYDSGPIVLQQAVEIDDCYSPEAIAGKVLACEHQIFPEAIKRLVEQEYRIEGNRVIFIRN